MTPEESQYIDDGGAAGTSSTRPRARSLDSVSTLQSQGQTPLPQYFIVRPGVTKHTASGMVTKPGPIVPLIAVDQLPEWLELEGVPRELDLEQTVGLTNLGVIERSPEFYEVCIHGSETQSEQGNREDDPRGPVHVQGRRAQETRDADSGLLPLECECESTVSSPPTTNSRREATAMAAGRTCRSYNNKRATQASITNLRARLHTPPATSTRAPSNPYPIIHTYPQLHPSPSPYNPYAASPPQPNPYKPSSSPSTPRNRNAVPGTNPGNSSVSTGVNSVYCRHWCHRGTCRWGAQCRYAHAMPSTAAGLTEVGLTHHPVWYTTAMRMAYGAGGLVHSSGSGSGSGGGGGRDIGIGGGGGSASGVGVVWYPSSHRRHGRRVPRGGESGRERGKGKGGEKQGSGKGTEGAGKGRGKGKGKRKELEDKTGGGKGTDSSGASETDQEVEEKARAADTQGGRKPEPQREPERLVEI